MKWIIYPCFLFCTLLCWAQPTYILFPKGKFNYVSTNFGPYRLVGKTFDEFEIYEKKELQTTCIGKIEKLNEWTRAYKCSLLDEPFCTFYSYFFSIGSLFDCLKRFEIFDDQENLIGSIEGKFNTDGAAAFLFYDIQGEIFAEAILDISCKLMTLYNSNNELLLTCSKTFEKGEWSHLSFSLPYHYPSIFDSEKEKKGATYYWTIEKKSEIPFDARFFWPFMAFISDVWFW